MDACTQNTGTARESVPRHALALGPRRTTHSDTGSHSKAALSRLPPIIVTVLRRRAYPKPAASHAEGVTVHACTRLTHARVHGGARSDWPSRRQTPHHIRKDRRHCDPSVEKAGPVGTATSADGVHGVAADTEALSTRAARTRTASVRSAASARVRSQTGLTQRTE